MKLKSSQDLKKSNRKQKNRGTSPRVAAVLKNLETNGIQQAKLADDAGLNRGVVNQLFSNKTGSSPYLVGRMCAVLDKPQATELLAAYLSDVAEAVAEEQRTAIRENCPCNGTILKSEKFSVLFPPLVSAAS